VVCIRQYAWRFSSREESESQELGDSKMLALLTLWLLASPVSCHISHDQKHLQPHAVKSDTRQSSAHFRREVLVDASAPTPFATPLPPVPTFATPLPTAAGGTKSGQGGEAVQAAGAVKASQLGAASKATTASASTNAPSPSTSTGENFVEQVGAGETCDIPLTLEECERLAGTLGLTWQRNEDADEQAEGRGRHCVVGREDADAAEGQDAAAAEGGAQGTMKYVRDGSASYPASCYCARSRIPGEVVFLLKHVETGKCLHSSGLTAKKGGALVLDTSCDVNDHELMLRKIATGSGAFLLKSVKTGLCASQNGNRLEWGKSCDENDDNLCCVRLA